MDVVKTRSRAGRNGPTGLHLWQGSKITLKLPPSMSIIRAMLVV